MTDFMMTTPTHLVRRVIILAPLVLALLQINANHAQTLQPATESIPQLLMESMGLVLVMLIILMRII
jgi:hypothetical protein